MPSFKYPNTLNYFLLLSVFIISPYYYQPNIGGLGLVLPFNLSAWACGIVFIVSVLFISSKATSFLCTRLFYYCMVFPCTIILAGIFTDNLQPVVWLFRQLYIIGGILFLFSLFQLKLTTFQVERLLYWIAFSALIHAFIGFLQLHDIDTLSGWMTMSANQMPIGVFQQVNLQAIYLVSGIQICLYLISRPSFISTKVWIRAFFIFTISLSVYVALCTGSRAGSLSLILASLVMLSSRYHQLKRHRLIMLLIGLSVSLSVFLAQDGIHLAKEKTNQITSGEYQSIRSTMYATTIDLIKEKPLLGYGIGSFPSVWAEQSIQFAKVHPNANISQQTTNHPHNEILLWMVEGGLLALIGIILIVIAIISALKYCGTSRGGAYAALLIPISLHTQVELPFYGSTIHWFLWLFFIYMIFRHQLKTYTFFLSNTVKKSIQFLLIAVVLFGLLFLYHAGKAQNEIYNYKFNDGGDLTIPLSNLYFNSVAERIVMQNMLYNAIVDKEYSSIPVFISWAQREIKRYPSQGFYLMLSDAYGAMGDRKNQCMIAHTGLLIYTKNQYLGNVIVGCEHLN